MPRSITPESIRFWSKVRIASNGCWEWIGARSDGGYGKFGMRLDNGLFRSENAHAWAYKHTIGSVPTGKELDHICRNLTCVNPLHLEPVTHRQNILRGKTAPAANVLKTHCPKGHPYSGYNLEINKKGWRRCKICSHLSGIKRHLSALARIYN